MQFGNPRMLWLLAITLPLLVWFFTWAWRKKRRLIGCFVQSRMLAQLTVGVSARRQQVRLALLTLAVALILFALAQPRLGFAWEEARQRGLDILVAIDTSKSMLATDVAPGRLARARLAALDLMRAAQSDRLGLIAFAGTAFLQCPLTLDDAAFSQSVNSLDADIIPQGGTALAEAIDTALRAFKDSGDSHKALIILTDGEDHEEGVHAAAERAASAGVRIYTIGIGTPQGERIRVVNEEGRTSYLNDLDGKQVVSKLNATLLQQVAAITGGEYLGLQGREPMKLLYDARLAGLPRSELASRFFRQYFERFQWPLSLAILLLALEPFIHERRLVRRAATAVTSTPLPLRALVISLVPLAFALDLQASASRALWDYEQGRYDDAQREYERLLQKRPDDARLRFNAGTTASRAGHLQAATNQLESAVLSHDPELLGPAYYNLGNARYRLGSQASEPGAKQALWEQAVRDYESTLKLAPSDADAQFNREFVKRKLEELRQQQQQQKQDPQQQDQKKDQEEDQQQDPQKQDSQQDQQQQQQPPPRDPQDNPDNASQQPRPDSQNSKPPPAPKPDTKEPDKSPGKEDEKPEPKPAPAQSEPADESKAKEEGNSQAQATTPLGQMTPQQARQLLEAARAEERPMIFVPPADPRRRLQIRREW